jgi:hypothetical protein
MRVKFDVSGNFVRDSVVNLKIAFFVFLKTDFAMISVSLNECGLENLRERLAASDESAPNRRRISKTVLR